MPTLQLLLIIAISVAGISIILSIIDWVFLLSLGGKTASLEHEIEKKSTEFDLIKKDRAHIQERQPDTTMVIESSEQHYDPEPSPASNETIQIIRNVRGVFEPSELPPHSNSLDYPPPSEHDNLPGNQSNAANDFSSVVPQGSDTMEKQPPPNHEPAPPSFSFDQHLTQFDTNQQPFVMPAPPAALQQPKPQENHLEEQPTFAAQDEPEETEGEILDVVGEEHNADLTAAPITLGLYSETTKDADFQQLGKNLSEILNQLRQPKIQINFSGINFIYDNEMDYLEKMYYLIAGRGGSFSLVNCDRELMPLIGSRPLLRSITKQKPS